MFLNILYQLKSRICSTDQTIAPIYIAAPAPRSWNFGLGPSYTRNTDCLRLLGPFKTIPFLLVVVTRNI